MKRLIIHLADELYDELVIAAADSVEIDEEERHLDPDKFASQCVESVLASRRLDRISA